MTDRFRQFVIESREAVAWKAMEDHARWLDFHLGDCESEIERLMMAAFVLQERLEYDDPPDFLIDLGGWYSPEDRIFSKVAAEAWGTMIDRHKAGYLCGMTFVFPQVTIGVYRVDFLIGHLECGENKGAYYHQNWVVVECDGHEFHEKTKEQARRDKARDRFLVLQGFKVLRFTGAEIWQDPRACVEEAVKIAKFSEHSPVEVES